MSQLARFSRGLRVALRNIPSIFLHKHVSAMSPTDWLKKVNPWKRIPSYFNTNAITNPRPLVLPPSLPSATSKDKDAGTRKKIFKGRMEIHRLLVDYDDPQNHLIDGVKVLSFALQVWKSNRPDLELGYGVGDTMIPPTLFRLSSFLMGDKEATSKKISTSLQTILKLLSDYDDPKVGDKVLLGALHTWMDIIYHIELECKNEGSTNNTIPLAVTLWIDVYKMIINFSDDPDVISKAVSLIGDEMKK